MPNQLSSAQIRGARGMLGWSMINLAFAARVSVSMIKRIESGVPQTIPDDAWGLVQDALETEGVRFLADDGNGSGMRLRQR